MAIYLELPDAEPDREQEGDRWLFSDDAGHSDWALSADELPELHATYRKARCYTVKRYPGATAAQLLEAEQDRIDSGLRFHPSLSAAERNA